MAHDALHTPKFVPILKAAQCCRLRYADSCRFEVNDITARLMKHEWQPVRIEVAYRKSPLVYCAIAVCVLRQQLGGGNKFISCPPRARQRHIRLRKEVGEVARNTCGHQRRHCHCLLSMAHKLRRLRKEPFHRITAIGLDQAV